MKPHKHAELIKAWADGAKIQIRVTDQFQDANSDCLVWLEDYEYRIKPEPKPDVVDYVCLVRNGGMTFFGEYDNNLKLTFDGETGKLKDAEVLK